MPRRPAVYRPGFQPRARLPDVHHPDRQGAGGGGENAELDNLRQRRHEYFTHGQDLRRGGYSVYDLASSVAP